MDAFFKNLKDQIVQINENFSEQRVNIRRAIQYPNLMSWVKEELGYPVEKHIYTTKDGYLNTCFRIPGRKSTTVEECREQMKVKSKPVVIYQHGLQDSCAGIICDGDCSLGLRLVDAGFDLWLNNSRGNRFSHEHQWIDL